MGGQDDPSDRGTPRSPALLTVFALLAGLGAGIAAVRWFPDLGREIAGAIEPVGLLWCDAMRVLAYPLLVCLMVDAVAGRVHASTGRMSLVSLLVFLSFLAAGGLLTLAVGPPLLDLLGVAPGALSGRSPAPESGPPAASGDWLTTVFGGRFDRALVGGNLLAVVLVSLTAAVAIGRLPQQTRRMLLDPVRAALEVLLVILSWLLMAAPVGVLVLGFAAGTRGGLAAAGALASFVGVVIVLLLVLTALCYPAAGVIGGVPVVRFARSAAGAQGVALGTRSSIASLPALLDSGRRLGLPGEVTAFVLPLSVAVFKANRTVSGTVKYLFLTQVYGMDVTTGDTVAYVNPSVVVEKFLPERRGRLYVVRMHNAFGDRERLRVLASRRPQVKAWNGELAERTETPPEVRAWRERFGLNYGKIDFVMRDGTPVLIDVNPTPTMSTPNNAVRIERSAELSMGLGYFEACAR